MTSKKPINLFNFLGFNIVFLFFILFTNSNRLYSQMDKEGFSTKSLFEEDIKNQLSSNALSQTSTSPIGNYIDPDFYYPGPGDLLLLKIFPVSNIENYVEVTPDNLLILPRNYGEVNVKNKSLTQVKLEVDSIIKSNIKDSRVILSIKKARNCVITVTGNVTFPGTYVFPATYKISTVLIYINRISADEKTNPTLQTLSMENQRRRNEYETAFLSSGISPSAIYSSRNIVVIRNNGKSLNVDLEKAFAVQEKSFDPHIKEGDKIYVPKEEINIPTISISGEVIRPTTLQFKKGDKLSFLIKCGAGLKSTADNSKIFFYNATGGKVNIQVDEEMNLIGQDFDLSPGCFVVVEKNDEFSDNNNAMVSIRGQVGKEGIYQITNKKTTLKELIEMAGGLGTNAYLSESYIMRRTNNQNTFEDKKKELIDYFQNSDLTLEDTTRLIMDLYNKKPFVSCDFVKAINPQSKSDEVILENGDVISIPEKPNKIYVFGKVEKPGFLEFSEGKDLLWYINKSGGYSSIAESNRTRIIRGASKIWLDPEEHQIIDGDMIYVPSKPDIPKQVSDQQYALIASVIGALASLTFLLVNTLK